MFTALPAIAVLAVLGALLAVSHRNASRDDRRQETRALAEAAATNAERFLDDQFAILATIAATPDARRSDYEALAPYIRAVARGERFGSGLGAIDRKGFSRVSSNPLPPGTPPVDVSDRDYFREAIGGRRALSDVLISKVRKRPIVVFAYPVMDTRGRPNGAIAGSLDLETFDAGLRRLLYAPGAGETIIDGDDKVIVGDHPVRGLQAVPGFIPLERVRSRPVGVVDKAAGESTLGFAEVRGTPWVVVVDRPYADVLGPLDNALWLEIGALALFALLGVFLTFLVARRLDRLDREREDALAEQREIALALQQSLLPALEVPEGLAVSAHYVPAQGVTAVGGDWFDLIDGQDGRVTLNVGDVAGHGLDAAATMGKLRSAARVEGLRGSAPADALTALDRFAGSLWLRPLATVAYTVLDLRTGALRYALAGHPPPLLIRADGRATYLDGGRSPLLGVRPVEPRPEGEVTLRPGDTLVIYTDGLVERPEASIDEGLAALAERATRLAAEDVAQLAERLLAHVPEPRRDDAAVLAVQLAPVRQPSSVAS